MEEDDPFTDMLGYPFRRHRDFHAMNIHLVAFLKASGLRGYTASYLLLGYLSPYGLSSSERAFNSSLLAFGGMSLMFMGIAGPLD